MGDGTVTPTVVCGGGYREENGTVVNDEDKEFLWRGL